MIQAKQGQSINKAVYFGKNNEEIRRLNDYLKRCSKDEVPWQLEIVLDHFLFQSHLRERRFDSILLQLSTDLSANANVLEMISIHAPTTSVIGVSAHNPSQYAPLMLAGQIQDILDGRQEASEFVKVMDASLERKKLASMTQEQRISSDSRELYWGGKTMAQAATRIPNIVNSAITCIHITGESGTGKEVVAQMIREAIGDVPFVAISCATIPETLLEATLFGSVKGAYTGATKDLKGVFEEADGGWIFLDEIGCLSKAAQAALLRAIENQEVTPVGESRTKKLHFRVISATNANLKEMTKTGEFRRDLYNRLAEVEICLPPLRERRDELPQIIECLVETLPGGPYRISSAAKSLLETHSWTEGNVRQLRNCLRAMTEFHVEGTLTPQAIPRKVLEEACDYAKSRAGDSLSVLSTSEGLGSLERASKRGLWVRLDFSENDEVDFDRMSLELFVEVAKVVTIRNGRFSHSDLAAALRVSRSTISRRLNEAIEQRVGDIDTLMASYGM